MTFAIKPIGAQEERNQSGAPDQLRMADQGFGEDGGRKSSGEPETMRSRVRQSERNVVKLGKG